MNKRMAAVITLAGVIGTGTIAHAQQYETTLMQAQVSGTVQAGIALMPVSAAATVAPIAARAQSAAPSSVGGSPTPETLQATLNELQREIVELKREQAVMNHQQAVAANNAAKTEAGEWHLKGGKNTVVPEFVSNDGKSWVKIGGRLQVDMAINQPPQKGGLPTGGARLNAGFRRVRIQIQGQFDQYWIWKLEYDFTGSTARAGIEDAWAGWHGKIGSVYNIFLLGNQYVPFGLQTPSNFRTWMELPLASNAFRPGRELGATGQSSQKHWNFWYGVFNGRNPDGTSKPYGEPATFTAAGNLAFNLINEPGRLIRIGNSLLYQEFGSAGQLYETFPDSKEYGADLVATPEMLGARSDIIYSPNIAIQHGPLTLHANYYLVRATGEAAGLSHSADLQGNASFSGWDVQAEYMLTGEVRPYSTAHGSFVGVKPLDPITDGGWGAWQIKGRVDSVDLNDREHDVMGGRETNVEAGLNWYPTSFTRVDLEYIKVLRIAGGPYNGYAPSIVQARLQFVF
jgi:phosphate-selective porin OprO and OprP